jgi:hypothetical protein
MEKKSPEYDYLDEMIQAQIAELRRFGPLVFDIFETLGPMGGAPVPALVDEVVRRSRSRVIVQPNVEQLAFRSEPSSSAQLIRALPMGTELLVLEPGGEAKIGQPQQYVFVNDADGTRGFVAGSYVMKVEQSAQEQVEKTLKMLEQLSSREIISITGEGNQLYAALTPKGKHIADELLAQR